MYYDYLSIWVFLYWRFSVVLHIAGICSREAINGYIGKFQFFVNLPSFNTFRHGIANYQSFFFLSTAIVVYLISVAAFIYDCNRLSPELLLKLSSIFSNGPYLLRSQNQCHYLFYYFYQFLFIWFWFCVGVMKQLLSWESIFSFCRFKLFW